MRGGEVSSALSKTCDLEFSNGFGRLLLITPFSHLSPVKPSSCSLCIKEVDCFLMSYTCCFTPLPRFRSGHSKNLIFHIFISAPPLSAATRAEADMAFYDNIYPFYHIQRTPFIFNGHLLTVIICFLVLTLCLLLILPGIRGKWVSASLSK